MAVGLTDLPDLHPVAGVRLGVASAGVRKPGRTDLMLLEVARGSAVAAVFTRNAFCAAPVVVAREHLERSAPRLLLVNSGNANAGTGGAGLEAARACCRALAEAVGCRPEEVLPFSTGVIGEPLPVERIVAALGSALADLSEDGWGDAARAIMTTDTVPKGISRRVVLDGRPVTVTGIAKGAGMIRPDMATMLCYVATDAWVAPALLQRCLEGAVERSFNRITVDGDTSTNDACVVAATGGAGVRLEEDDERLRTFATALEEVCTHLAHAIVRDGEGATKFVTVTVEGGASRAECLQAAYAIAHSPLVKTALFASDPNWGRILAAVGRAGIPDLDVGRIDIYLGDVRIVRSGGRDPDYTEERGQAVMQREEIAIGVDLGRGPYVETVWTTDLSFDYVRINAEYRT